MNSIRLLLSFAAFGLPMVAEPADSGSTMPFTKRTYVYKTVDGCAIKADVYRPDDAVVRPVILWIHGGALMMGGRENLRRDQRERYLAAGYAVVSIDYRLAPESKLPAVIEDVRDAYRWLRQEGPVRFQIDPDRVAVIGHSAGGYLTLLAGHHLHPRPRALVSFYGYGDITGEWYSRPDPFYNQLPAIASEEAYQAVADKPISEDPPRGRPRLYRYFRQQGIWPDEVTGHDPDLEPQVFDPWCPLRNVTSNYPPTVLLHGDGDTDVPVEQSALMAAELARQGVEHEFLRREDWVHSFDGVRPGMKDPEIARAFDRVIAFLDRHLRPDVRRQMSDVSVRRLLHSSF